MKSTAIAVVSPVAPIVLRLIDNVAPPFPKVTDLAVDSVFDSNNGLVASTDDAFEVVIVSCLGSFSTLILAVSFWLTCVG